MDIKIQNDEIQNQVDNRSLEKKLQALSLGEPVCLTAEEKQQIDNLDEALLDDESCAALADKVGTDTQSKTMQTKQA